MFRNAEEESRSVVVSIVVWRVRGPRASRSFFVRLHPHTMRTVHTHTLALSLSQLRSLSHCRLGTVSLWDERLFLALLSLCQLFLVFRYSAADSATGYRKLCVRVSETVCVCWLVSFHDRAEDVLGGRKRGNLGEAGEENNPSFIKREEPECVAVWCPRGCPTRVDHRKTF
jgi:hypothetical protein